MKSNILSVVLAASLGWMTGCGNATGLKVTSKKSPISNRLELKNKSQPDGMQVDLKLPYCKPPYLLKDTLEIQ